MSHESTMRRREFLSRGAKLALAGSAAPYLLSPARALAGDGAGQLGLVGTDHVGVTVPDINQAIEWFEDVMGAVAPLSFGRAGVRIMIADDEAAIRESLEQVLQIEGYDTSAVANGLAVLDGVGDDAPDLLILDVMMPRLGGLETCRRLRAAGRDLPVLMLTARDQVSDRVAGLDAGADDYLPKPFATEELLARVRALLRAACRAKTSRRSCRSPTSGSILTGSRRGVAGGRCA